MGTGTGIMTHYFNLFVIVPTAVIPGNDEYHIGEGSSITLLCKIENVSILYYYYYYDTISAHYGDEVLPQTVSGHCLSSNLMLNYG